MKPFLSILFFLFCIVCKVVAQRDVVLNHYWAMPSIYNPAVAGSTDYLEAGLSGRWQHAGSTDAPIMVVATAHMPIEFLERRHGVGAVVSYENVGKNHFVQLGVQYAFQMKLGKGKLHLSIQPTIVNWKFNGSSYNNEDSTSTSLPYPFEENNISKEQIPTSDVNDNKLDLSLGAVYFYKNWHFGISCTHITKPTFQFSDTCEISCYPSLYCTIGTIFKYNMYSLEILPNLLFNTTHSIWRLEASVRAVWRKRWSIGAGYRHKEGIMLFLGANIKGVSILYSYEHTTAYKMDAHAGSHELTLLYSFDIKSNKKRNNCVQSIRFL